MGYYIRTIEGNITIPAEKRAGALAALKARLLARESAYYGGDKRELAANDPLYSAETLAEVLNQFYIGYDEYEDDGSLCIYNFEGKQSIGFDEIGRAPSRVRHGRGLPRLPRRRHPPVALVLHREELLPANRHDHVAAGRRGRGEEQCLR